VAPNTWVIKTNATTALYGARGAAIGTKVYVVDGGLTNTPTFSNALYEYDEPTDTWATKAASPTAVEFPAVASIGSKLYAAGGDIGGAINNLYEWDQGSDTWATKTNMVVKLTQAGGASIGTKLYVAAGSVNGAGAPNGVLYEWDQGSNTWATKATMPVTNVYACGVAAIGTKVYVSGGYDGAAAPTKKLYEWDQGSNTWATKADMPANLIHHGMVSFGKRLLVYGGRNFAAVNSGVSLKTYEWNQASNKWVTRADMPAQRQLIAAAATPTHAYSMTGYDTTGATMTNSNYQYTPLPLTGWHVGGIRIA
jgi:hypothetical protein